MPSSPPVRFWIEREREIFIHGKGLVIPDIWKCTSWPTLYKHKTGAYFIGLRANACMVPQLGQCAPNDIQKGHCPLLMWLAARPFLQWTPKSTPFQFLPPLRFCQSSYQSTLPAQGWKGGACGRGPFKKPLMTVPMEEILAIHHSIYEMMLIIPILHPWLLIRDSRIPRDLYFLLWLPRIFSVKGLCDCRRSCYGEL